MRTALIRGTASVLVVAGISAIFAGTAHAAVGARVLVQQWSPLAPDKQDVKVLVDRPSVVSDSLMSAWSKARLEICNGLTQAMGQPGAAAGQTLRDIDCQLDENAALEILATRPNNIAATFTIHGNSITATSTQPTVCGRECDPRFSLTLDATFELNLATQPSPDQLLVVSTATFTLANASLDSHNFSGDVLEFVAGDLVPFFGGPNYKRLAENAINSASMNLAPTFNSALSPVNALMKGPAGYVRVGFWGRPNRITVAFAPREITPPANGAMSGVVRWNPGEYTPRNGCTDFNLVATVQTGPAPLLNPDDYSVLGPAPQRQIGRFSASSAGDAQCSFSLSGLAAKWPNYVTARLAGGNAGRRSGVVVLRYALEPDGWKGPVVPEPSAGGRNYIVARGYGGVDAEVNPLHNPTHPGDPVIDPGASIERRAAISRGANPAGMTGGQRSVKAPAQVKAPVQAAKRKTRSVRQDTAAWRNARPLSPSAVSPAAGSIAPPVSQPAAAAPAAAIHAGAIRSGRVETRSLTPKALAPNPPNPASSRAPSSKASPLNRRGIIIVGGKPVEQTQNPTASPAASQAVKDGIIIVGGKPGQRTAAKERSLQEQ